MRSVTENLTAMCSKCITYKLIDRNEVHVNMLLRSQLRPCESDRICVISYLSIYQEANASAGV